VPSIAVVAALWRDALLSVVMDAPAARFEQTLMMLVRLILLAEAGRLKRARISKARQTSGFRRFPPEPPQP